MSVKAINTSLNTRREYTPQKRNNNSQNNTPSFTGFGNPIVLMMDAIDRGGFAASFIAQDGIGMVAPRIWEGLNRNRKREKDPITGEETGKKTGPLNWEFARREGIREILSGPSAFLIPAAMLVGIKKYSGTANNVHIDHINAFGKSFANFAENNAELLADTEIIPAKAGFLQKILGNSLYNRLNPPKELSVKAKEKFYTRIFKNVLNSSLENQLPDKELEKTAQEFTKSYMAAENAPSKGFWKVFIGKAKEGSKEDLKGALTERYMNLRKQLMPSSINELDAVIQVEGTNKRVKTNFSRVLSSLTDYSDDVLVNSQKYIKKNGTEKVGDFLKHFNNRRIGTRVMSIASMFAAVVAFYTVIPKLYNMGLKHDPGLAGLVEEPETPTNTNVTAANQSNTITEKVEDKVDTKDTKSETGSKDAKTPKDGVAFTGAFQTGARKLGETISSSDFAKKAVSKFEFNDASMSVPAMLTLLFAFCLPPRYKNAKSDKERKEILVRDISSFSAILFGANALARLTSVLFSKLSGLVLNVKPEDHNKSIFHQVKNYLTPGKGIEVLKGAQIDSKYSNLEGYKNRIVGFIELHENEGCDVKKVFRMDKEVRKNIESILGKSLKETSTDELKSVLKAIDDDLLKGADTPAVAALKKVYARFGANNKFTNIAKTCNSTFGALATLALVPLFMIKVARYCENMTKKRVAEEQAAIAAEAQKNAPITHLKNMLTNVMPSQKPTMTGFLNN